VAIIGLVALGIVLTSALAETRSILEAGALALAVAVGLGLVIARRLTAPLRLMRAAALRMARGSYGERVPVASRDELGELASALNALAASLERAETLRQTMVADLAHELRTPLATIRATVEALRDGIMEPTPATLTALSDETLRISRLVGDLQELALLEAGRLTIDARPVDLGRVLERVLAVREPDLAAKKLRVDRAVPPGGAWVVADPDRATQILHNLLDNALKYTPEGGRIAVEMWIEEGLLFTRVSDTGPGIDPGELPLVFERFYRSDKARSRGTGGVGLGLTITRKLVEAHGGTIVARSRPGRGTAFIFSLPVAPPLAAAELPAAGPRWPPRHEVRTGRPDAASRP